LPFAPLAVVTRNRVMRALDLLGSPLGNKGKIDSHGLITDLNRNELPTLELVLRDLNVTVA
jgi:hypothetical protein